MDTDLSQTVHLALQEFNRALQALYGQQSPEIFIYGSYARGEAGFDSDIDVLLLYKKQIQPGKELERMAPILSQLNLQYGVLISILPTSAEEYQHSERFFWQNVRREGIALNVF